MEGRFVAHFNDLCTIYGRKLVSPSVIHKNSILNGRKTFPQTTPSTKKRPPYGQEVVSRPVIHNFRTIHERDQNPPPVIHKNNIFYGRKALSQLIIHKNRFLCGRDAVSPSVIHKNSRRKKQHPSINRGHFMDAKAHPGRTKD